MAAGFREVVVGDRIVLNEVQPIYFLAHSLGQVPEVRHREAAVPSGLGVEVDGCAEGQVERTRSKLEEST